MSSPFSIFRQHQRLMMVVITGLSMISFVLLGAVQDPTKLPMPLVVIFLAAMAGGIAWLAGLNSGKGAEWGLTGAVAGLLIGLGGAYLNQEPSAVLIDNGNLSAQQVFDLRRQQSVVNQFTNTVFQETFSLPMQYLPAPIQRNYSFGFGNGNEITEQDVALGELLSREADKMGIVVSDKVVWDYIKQISSKKGLMELFDRAKGQINPQEAMIWNFQLQQIADKPFTAQAFTRIRQAMRVPESELINALRNELKIRQAYQLLSGNNYFPPEQFWMYFQQMNIKQTADVAAVSAKDFIDPDAKPSDADLQKLFTEYKGSFPGFNAQGRPEPGRPGFYQPRRVQVGYLTADYEKIEPLVGEVTEEEIQKKYEELYLKKVPGEGMPAGEPLDGPNLPPAPTGDQPATTPGSEPSEKMPADKPAAEAPQPEAKPATPAPEVKEQPQPEKPASEKPAEGTPETKPEPEAKSSSMLPFLQGTQPVAFLLAEGDTAPADAPAPDAPAEENPAGESATEKPAAEKPVTPEKPAADENAPAEEKKPAPVDVPAPPVDAPPAPESDVPPLDDAMKARLRGEILKERTLQEISRRMEAAQNEMSELADAMSREKTEKGYLSLEDATKRLEQYATKHQLVYVVTPLMSYTDLAESEDYPVGRALIPQQRMMVSDYLMRSLPSDLHRVTTASDFTTSDAYVFWKLADKADYSPNSMDDEPGLHADVVEAWNLQQARPKAKARAEELAKMVKESGKPMAEVLAEQTVTGKEGSLFIPVRQTGEFTWMQRPIVPQTSMGQEQPVRASIIPGVSNTGEEFFRKVFEEMKVGDVGVAPDNDIETFYVVKIDSRDPSTPEQLEALRKKFLAEGMQGGGYSSLLQQSISENSVNWLQQLYDSHDVVIPRQMGVN